VNISISWSRSLLPENRESRREAQLRQEVFDIAEVLAPRLRSVPEPRVDRFFGFVDELRGQPSRDDPRPSGEVRFTLFDQGEEIRAKADLSPEDYAVASGAHLSNGFVSFKGIPERLPRLNRIKNVTDFAIVDLDGDGVSPEPDEGE
jgi:hypothetical protein